MNFLFGGSGNWPPRQPNNYSGVHHSSNKDFSEEEDEDEDYVVYDAQGDLIPQQVALQRQAELTRGAEEATDVTAAPAATTGTQHRQVSSPSLSPAWETASVPFREVIFAMAEKTTATMDNAVQVPRALQSAGRRTMFDVLCALNASKQGQEGKYEQPMPSRNQQGVLPEDHVQPSSLSAKVSNSEPVDLSRSLRHLLPSNARSRQLKEQQEQGAGGQTNQDATSVSQQHAALEISDFSDDDDDGNSSSCNNNNNVSHGGGATCAAANAKKKPMGGSEEDEDDYREDFSDGAEWRGKKTTATETKRSKKKNILSLFDDDEGSQGAARTALQGRRKRGTVGTSFLEKQLRGQDDQRGEVTSRKLQRPRSTAHGRTSVLSIFHAAEYESSEEDDKDKEEERQLRRQRRGQRNTTAVDDRASTIDALLDRVDYPNNEMKGSLLVRQQLPQQQQLNKRRLDELIDCDSSLNQEGLLRPHTMRGRASGSTEPPRPPSGKLATILLHALTTVSETRRAAAVSRPPGGALHEDSREYDRNAFGSGAVWSESNRAVAPAVLAGRLAKIAKVATAFRVVEYLHRSFKEWTVNAGLLLQSAKEAAARTFLRTDDNEGEEERVEMPLCTPPQASVSLNALERESGVHVKFRVTSMDAAFGVVRVQGSLEWLSSLARPLLYPNELQEQTGTDLDRRDSQRQQWEILIPEQVFQSLPIRLSQCIYLGIPFFPYVSMHCVLASYNVTSDALIVEQTQAYESALAMSAATATAVLEASQRHERLRDDGAASSCLEERGHSPFDHTRLSPSDITPTHQLRSLKSPTSHMGSGSEARGNDGVETLTPGGPGGNRPYGFMAPDTLVPASMNDYYTPFKGGYYDPLAFPQLTPGGGHPSTTVKGEGLGGPLHHYGQLERNGGFSSTSSGRRWVGDGGSPGKRHGGDAAELEREMDDPLGEGFPRGPGPEWDVPLEVIRMLVASSVGGGDVCGDAIGGAQGITHHPSLGHASVTLARQVGVVPASAGADCGEEPESPPSSLLSRSVPEQEVTDTQENLCEHVEAVAERGHAPTSYEPDVQEGDVSQQQQRLSTTYSYCEVYLSD